MTYYPQSRRRAYLTNYEILSNHSIFFLIPPDTNIRFMLDADMLKIGAETDLKIYDNAIMHHFRINNEVVLSYSVNDRRGEPIAKSSAEVVADDSSLIIRTQVIDFEVVQDRNFRYLAYKKIRH